MRRRRRRRALHPPAQPPRVDTTRSKILDPSRFRPQLTLTGPQAAAQAGTDYEVARRFWRALGLPDLRPDEVGFEERDVKALETVERLEQRGLPVEDLVNVARTYGKALSMIADTEARMFARNIVEPRLAQGGQTSDIEDEVRPLVEWLLGISAGLLDYAHRRHLVVAVEALTAGVTLDATEGLAVAFVDLVDFSRMSDSLGGHELGHLIQRFEDAAIAATAGSDVHLVKMIGDAVMITSPDASALTDVVLGLVENVEQDPDLPQARAGLDFGGLVPLAGDYFGRPANVAARLTAFARPGTVVASNEVISRVDLSDIETTSIGTRSFKGVGKISTSKVARAQ